MVNTIKNKYSYELELDVDGVLVNMDGSYKPYIEHIIPNFSEEEHILNWGIPEIKESHPEAYDIIFGLYSNPKFIRHLPLYDGIEEDLKLLYNLMQLTNGRLVIHTHIFNDVCAIERRLYLETLRLKLNIDYDIEISVGDKKQTRTTSYIVIEDNIKNISLSNAPIKILMRRGHNRSFDISSLNAERNKYEVTKLSEVLPILEQELGVNNDKK